MGRSGHEKLLAYQRALESRAALQVVIDRMPPRVGDLREQLRCAANSMVLNLAEGAGEYSAAEKARIYRVSLRSGTECMAVLDIIRVLGHSSSAEDEARQLLDATIGLTTKLVGAMTRRAAASGDRP